MELVGIDQNIFSRSMFRVKERSKTTEMSAQAKDFENFHNAELHILKGDTAEYFFL